MEQGSALGGEQAGSDFDAVVEFRRVEDFETGAESASLWIVGSIREPWDAGLNNGASTHGARFESDIKGGVGEAIVSEEPGRIADNHNFGVSGGIVVANGAITRAGEDFIAVRENGADGDFAGLGRGLSFRESELHEIKVVVWHERGRE